MFVETLDELNWMDEESKKKAQEKVGKPRGPHSPEVRTPPRGAAPGTRNGSSAGESPTTPGTS